MESTTQIFLRVQISDDDDHVIEGESLATGYADRMQIDSFSFGMDAKDQAQRPGKGANIDLNQVQVTKFFDLASTKLAGLLKASERDKEPNLLHEVRITIDQQLEEVGERGKMEKQQNAILVFHLFKARLVDIKLDVSGDTRATTLK